MHKEIVSYDCDKKEFKYTLNGVIVNSQFLIPKNLYKFYSLNNYSLKALSENYLYASNNLELNDLLDCSYKILGYDSFENIEKAKLFYLKLASLKVNDSNKKSIINLESENNFKNLNKFIYYYYSGQFRNISLTEKFDNVLLWAHYAMNNGFCIEFDSESLIENNTLNEDVLKVYSRPVQYIDNIEILDIAKKGFEINDILIPILYLTNLKSIDWKYEKEYRITIFKNDMDVPFNKLNSAYQYYKGHNNSNFNYSEKSIKRIFIGRNFLNSEFIKLEKNKDLLFYNLIKSNDLVYRTYNDEFERIKVKNEYEIFKQFMSILFEKYSEKIYMMEDVVEDGKLKIKPHKLKLMKIEGEDRYQFIDESKKE